MESTAPKKPADPSEEHHLHVVPVQPGAVEDLESVTVRFCGDSGDGMQLTGTEFTKASALAGNDLATFPDYPAEIRAPAGTLPGVSGFQIQFSSHEILTPGDAPDVLVAMNPAALKTNLADLVPNGILIVNSGAYNEQNLQKAGYAQNPLEDDSLKGYRLYKVDISKLTSIALEGSGLSTKEIGRSKNMFALGMMFWMYSRPMDQTVDWLRSKFAKVPAIAEANVKVLKAGFHFGETTEIFTHQYEVKPAKLAPGRYRNITGNQAAALGFVAAAQQSGVRLFLGSYPITPASDILHELSVYKNFGVMTFQAEDEIAGMCSAIGASFGGCLALTTSSGPGIALKGEAMGMATMLELPVVICNIQRGGPSTGLPTKTEQADLLQALFGRNGECPLAVVAPNSPGDCFTMAMEAVRIAVRFMTPVILLSDGYLANGAEPWMIPDVSSLPPITVRHPTEANGEEDGNPHFFPYLRDERLVRPWAIPGTPGLEHRIGGLEKEDVTGNVNYEPENHEHMVHTRAQKIANIANEIPPLEVSGPSEGDLLVIGWGGTYGSIRTAVQKAQGRGLRVAQAHLRYLNPMPKNTGEVLRRYKRVLVPELNGGQLCLLLRAAFLVDAVSLSKVQGKPFLINELESRIDEMVSR
jgi:2-oxoglutarate/2-oxoacid ferredoxin oxidoreductase subunit alpha